LAGIFTGSIRIKALKQFGRKWSVGVSRDYRNVLSTPLLSQERVKLRTSTFVRTFLVSIGTKPITNFGKSSCGLVRSREIFQGTHILGASRGRLWDSSAFLFSLTGRCIVHWAVAGQPSCRQRLAYAKRLRGRAD